MGFYRFYRRAPAQRWAGGLAGLTITSAFAAVIAINGAEVCRRSIRFRNLAFAALVGIYVAASTLHVDTLLCSVFNWPSAFRLLIVYFPYG